MLKTLRSSRAVFLAEIAKEIWKVKTRAMVFKSVPFEVLKDYPDLIEKYKTEVKQPEEILPETEKSLEKMQDNFVYNNKGEIEGEKKV